MQKSLCPKKSARQHFRTDAHPFHGTDQNQLKHSTGARLSLPRGSLASRNAAP